MHHKLIKDDLFKLFLSVTVKLSPEIFSLMLNYFYGSIQFLEIILVLLQSIGDLHLPLLGISCNYLFEFFKFIL
jgi:hypothetical protein